MVTRVPATLAGEIAGLARDVTAPITGFTLSPRDEILLRRAGGQGIRLYQDLARDGHAGAVLRKRRQAVVAREWTVEPAADAPADERAAALVRAALARIRFDRASAGLLAAVLTGYAVAEVLWEAAELELDDGTRGSFIVPADIRVRNARRFVLDRDGRLRLLTWEAPLDGIALPERKFLLVRYWAEENEDPYGRGLGHDLFWPIYFKRNALALWSALAEKFGQPFVYAEYPAGTTERDRQILLGAVQELARGGGLVVPQGTLVKFLEAGAGTGGSRLHAELVQAMDDEISKIVLGETLSTEMGAVGARAASETHEGVRQELADADADWLSAELNTSLLAWITEINLPGARPPAVWRRAPDATDLEQRTRIDEALFRIGYVPEEGYVAETYGPGYRRLAPAAPPVPPGPAFAEGPEDPVAALTARLAGDAAAAQALLLDAVRAETEAAQSLPELEQRLARLAGALPVRALAEKLGPAFALAYLAGADQADGETRDP
jgi:phage gp29-like protein